jgi:sodium-dependent phosphate cotransporter
LSAVTTASPTTDTPRAGQVRDLALTALLLYGFAVAVGLTAEGLVRFGEPTLDGLRDALAHPVFALCVGALSTLVLQSSSVTTSVIVAVAAATSLPVAHVVPLVLGANVGATVSSSLVGLGSAQASREFQRSFACASLHDLYNVCAVAVLLPLELATGFLSSTAGALAEACVGSGPSAVGQGWAGAGVGAVRDVLRGLGADDTILATLMLVAGVVLVQQMVHGLSSCMQRVLRPKTAAALDRTVAGDRGGALGFGLVAALAVQSGVVTTSMLVPLVAAGVLPLASAYPVMVGANVGTTLTAIMAALALLGPQALAVAIVHVAFNLIAALVFHGVAPLRAVPLTGARVLGRLAGSHRVVVLVGLLVVFVVLPVTGMLVLH